MEWTDDVSAGDWIRRRLDPEIGPTMHAVVPRGFAAYARIFHPTTRDRPVGRPWPPVPYDRHAREWDAFQSARPEIDTERVSWATTAAAFGTELHRSAQWHRLVRRDSQPAAGEGDARDAEGWRYGDPPIGELEPELVSELAALLRAHTGTPAEAFVAVWEGRGGLVGALGYGPSRVLLTLDDTESSPRHRDFLAHSVRDRFNDVFRKPSWQPGILSDEISRGARLSLPGRDHVLFTASLDELVDREWPRRVPWSDPGTASLGYDVGSPSLVWPADHAWVMVTEVDFDSTLIGGSVDLVDAICASTVIEALPTVEGADLREDADEVNR